MGFYLQIAAVESALILELFVFQEGIQLEHDVVGSHDTLRHGLPNFKNDVLPVHPVEVIQRTVSFSHLSLLVLVWS